MKKIRTHRKNAWAAGLMTVVWLLCATVTHAAIDGITGTTFDLTATTGAVVTSDGDSFQFWSYSTPSSNNGAMQYPGPTLIVNEGDAITVNLTNQLPQPQGGNTSIVFPGHSVSA
ncbi:MAG: multicopper oxidase domain-containing protein, partial [Sulfitobacter sp.]|nr:multicopper oxidase domain-containing protein [Sulfitobacter sp.]